MARAGDKAMALLASSAEAAQEAERLLRRRYDFVPLAEAEMVLAMGGDGFLLQTLHDMLSEDRLCPVFGMNLGTVGFLMNEWQIDGLIERLAAAKPFSVAPLENARAQAQRRADRASSDQRGLAPARDSADRLDRDIGQRSHRRPAAGLRRRAGGDARRIHGL
jgi:NAD kinase